MMNEKQVKKNGEFVRTACQGYHYVWCTHMLVESYFWSEEMLSLVSRPSVAGRGDPYLCKVPGKSSISDHSS